MQERWKNAEDVLNFAIRREEDAVNFYKRLAERAKRREMKQALLEMAEEEGKHRDRLAAIRDTGDLSHADTKVANLKVADYLVDVEFDPDMDYATAIVLAMKREKKAYKLYSDLARAVEREDLRQAFLLLAREEASHKLHFETEYDEHVMQEN